MRRVALLFGVLLLSAGALAAPAAAHPLSTSAILLDVRGDHVGGELQLPIDRLAIAVKRDLDRRNVLTSQRAFLTRYVEQHMSATGDDDVRWSLRLGRPYVEKLDSYATPHLVYPLRLTPPDGEVRGFRLRYDVIIEELRTHRAFATVRHDFDRGVLKREDAELVGVFDFSTTVLGVRSGGGSWLRGFTSTAGLGIEHVGEGADHLLFLLMLLIPAPLAAVAGRWQHGPSVRRSVVRVVHVVSAFAVGHSLTLALAGAGVIDLPSRPVETLIALSIAVSAVHAIRPLVPRGEVLIALGFGLVHGLAFASLIGELGLDRGSLVSSLLAFNLGIELTQLLVVASIMPSLVVLARTRVYPAFRVAVASVGLVWSVSWMLERSTVTRSDPFEGTQTWLVEHPFVVAAAVAVLALLASSASRRRPGGDARPVTS